ncbi:MAG: flagellar hook-basal body complex protein [Kordiimonadaceae bacterium]|nr:flagellar hook-basal body complex protein [Kordiimonadaceae bacterium]
MAFAALAAGVSGLQAFSESVGVIADNITNINTVGYKEARSRFSTLVTETGGNGGYSPGGVRQSTETLVTRQGLLQPSSNVTDLAIDGSGFFVVRNAESAGSTDGTLEFTRAGAFSQDSDGFFRNTAGLFLLGYEIDTAGNLPANLQSETSLSPINITELNGVSEATDSVALRVNLAASTATTSGYALGDLAARAADGVSGLAPDFQTNVQIFDSLGREHTVVVAAIKTGANSWDYEYYFDDASIVDSTAHPDGLIAQGTLVFNTDGSINLGSSSLNSVSGSTATAVTLPGGSLTFSYDTSGTVLVDAGSITIDFGTDSDTNGFTQFESGSALISSAVNGARFDNVNGISIDSNGIISALFDNGLSLEVFQLPLATFDNPNGLQRRAGNSFSLSDQSGSRTFSIPGTTGAGNITPSSLEQSTVDLANEFAELIRVQRAFSASTRIITTADELLEELTRL